jgi:hypothetical protein
VVFAEAHRSELKAALWAECVRVTRWPYDELMTIAANGALMCIAWFWLPTDLSDDFFSIHARLAFPVLLGTWMLADTPASNVLGMDADQALTALGDPVRMSRFLWAKHVVLAGVIGIIGIIATLLTAVGHRGDGAVIFRCSLVVAVPFGVVAVSSWIGIVFPFHQRSFRWRWEHRRDLRTGVRWALLVATPYFLVPVIGGVILGPSIALFRSLKKHGHVVAGQVSTGGFALVCIVALALSATVFFVGSRVALWLTVRRHDYLVAYLADPDRG